MKLAIRCKHCGTRRVWEQGADGVMRPEKTNGPHGVGHYPFRCAVAASQMCEPMAQETTAQRLVRDQAESAGRRWNGSNGHGKRR